MNIFNLNNNEPNEEIKKIQMDLEAPLLKLEKDHYNERDKDKSEDKSEECEIAEIHSAIPLIGGATFHHISEPCQGFSTANKKKSKEDADDDDDDDSETTLIDAQAECNVLNRTYCYGFVLGLIVQACSLYVVDMILPAAIVNGNVNGIVDGEGVTTLTTTVTTIITNKHNLSAPAVFTLYFFSRYWVLVALLLPPIVCAMRLKANRRRASASNKIKKNTSTTKEQKHQQKLQFKKSAAECVRSFFECIRFQFGLFFGSLIMLSVVNFYSLAQTTPLCMLLAYYSVCVVIASFSLCFVQVFVNQVCVNVSSVKIVVGYDDEEDDGDDIEE